ncbi:kinase, partial [Thraustotheca clavata]
ALDESHLTVAPVNLPASLSYLLVSQFTKDLKSNEIYALVDQDWRSLKTLITSDINTTVYVQFTTNLTYWLSLLLKFCRECISCKLKNFTVDDVTYAALNALMPYNQSVPGVGVSMYSVETSAEDCKSRSGTIKPIWPSFNGTVCVVSQSSLYPSTSSTNITFIIVAIIAAIIAVAILIGVFALKRKRAIDWTPKTSSSMSVDLDDLLAYKLDEKQLTIPKRKPLAEGAFGEVYLGKYAGNPVVIKRNKDHNKSALGVLIAEIKLLAKMDSPYIVQFIGVSWVRPIDMECVLEYMDLGDLRSYLAKYSLEQFTWAEKAKCIESIVNGLVYLHTFDPPIIHRDLKSNNVLLDSVKGTKITDFGVSKEIEDDATRTNGVGTYQWMAPEVITECHYTTAADIYSFGIVFKILSMHAMITHKVPYSGMTHSDTGRPVNQHYVINGVGKGNDRPEFSPSSPQWILDVGKMCLATNPDDRPTILELTVHTRHCDYCPCGLCWHIAMETQKNNRFENRLDEKHLPLSKRTELATGGYGEVYLARYAGTPVGIKRNKDKSKTALSILIAEIKLLA